MFLSVILSQGNLYLGSPLSDAQLNFLFFCVNFAATTVILGGFFLRSVKYGLQHIFRTLQSAFFGYALYCLAKFLVGIIIQYFFPGYVNENDRNVLYMLQQSPALITIGTVLLVPVAEELMYRAVIFGSLYERNKLLAYLISAVLFSVVHIISYLPDPLTFLISFIQYLPAGFCLAWAYARSGSILAPILIHIAVNQIGISILR